MKNFTFSLLVIKAGEHKGTVIPNQGVQQESIEAAEAFAASLAETHQRSLGDRSRVAYFNLACTDAEPAGDPQAA